MDGIERSIEMPLGVVVERRELNNRWQKLAWQPVAVIPGAATVDAWRELRRGDRWIQFHAATLALVLHRKETLAYKTNLSNAPPMIYVVLRADDDPTRAQPVRPFKVTASPFEAQDYLDSGEEIVEGVPMPDGVIAWVQGFVDRHHVDEPFIKRKRKRYDPNETGFGRRPEPRTKANGRGHA